MVCNKTFSVAMESLYVVYYYMLYTGIAIELGDYTELSAKGHMLCHTIFFLLFQPSLENVESQVDKMQPRKFR